MCTFFSALGQDNNLDPRYPNFVGGQLGGQTQISVHYEYSFLHKKNYYLNTNFGAGLNQSGDMEIGEKPIWGIHTGAICLYGIKSLYLEIGIDPTIYFYQSICFINLNSWVGFRYLSKGGFYIGAGYSPIVYKTYSDPNDHFADIYFGLKLGGNF